MMHFKLVNKTNKTVYPESFNEFTSQFYFDRALVNLYAYETEDASISVSDNAIVSNGILAYKGNLKADIDVFRLFLENTTAPENLIANWCLLMEAGYCSRLQELDFFIHYDLLSKYDHNYLMTKAMYHRSHTCVQYIIDHSDKNFKLEQYLNSVFDLEDLEFVKCVIPHFCMEYIMALDVDIITDRHRYKDVRKYLKRYKTYLLQHLLPGQFKFVLE